MNTKKSEELFARSLKVSPGGVHSPVRAFRGVGGTPRFIDSAKGVELTDVDGNKYIDFCLSWGPLIFGHQDGDVLEAARTALTKGWTYGTAEPLSLELAELMTSSIPWAEKVRFVNSGTEAVMAALRVARAATKRSKILKFDGCYHGHVDSMLVKAGSGLADMASPDSAGVSEAVANETLVCPLDDLNALKAIFEKHGKEIAAVIVEPVPANNGLLLQKKGFLTTVAETARKYGSLVIFDEVITGFRIRFGGMAELTGIRPDLVTYGKIIGGGFPVGAYGGRKDLMDLVAPLGPVYQAGTLSANPVAMSAGLAQLKKLKRVDPYTKLEEMNCQLAGRIQKVLDAKSKVPAKVQSFSSMFWMVFGEVKTADGVVRAQTQIPSAQKEVFAKGFHKMLEQGVYLAPSGYEVGFLSAAHEPKHLDLLVNSLEKSLD